MRSNVKGKDLIIMETERVLRRESVDNEKKNV